MTHMPNPIKRSWWRPHPLKAALAGSLSIVALARMVIHRINTDDIVGGFLLAILLAIPLAYARDITRWSLRPILGPPYWAIGRRREFKRVWNGKCYRCGYDVRGQTQRCPECGREIRTVAAYI